MGLRISPDFILKALIKHDGYQSYKDIIVTDVKKEDDYIYIDTVLINEEMNSLPKGRCDRYMVI